MKSLFMRMLGGFKGVAFILVMAAGLTLHVYIQHIIGQLRDEARSLVQFYAGLYSRVVDTESEDTISFIFDQIIRKTNFPLIQTDPEGNPVSWKGIGVDPDDRSDEAMHKVERMVRRMERDAEPVPIMYGESVLNYLHYGDSRLIQRLLWLPYIEIGIVGLFIIVGFIGHAYIKRSEQRHIWVGMAKETAHQLGTPISSLMGWLEIMRSGKRVDSKEIFKDMEKDLHRLQRVINRFAQIGSKPDLKESDVIPAIGEVVEYIRRRAPQMGRRVLIAESYTEVGTVPLNVGLFQWAVENMMKNAIDAMDKSEGQILIRMEPLEKGRRIAVEIEDNGKGIEKSEWKRIFKPGFSTKRRGWGLGLTLSKRIVEEYHGGKLLVKESKPGVGTVMRIEL